MKTGSKKISKGYICTEDDHVFMAVFFCVAQIGVWRCLLWDVIGNGLFFYTFHETESMIYKNNPKRGK